MWHLTQSLSNPVLLWLHDYILSFLIFQILKKFYFIIYAITVGPYVSPLSSSTQPPTPSGNPHTVVQVHGSPHICSLDTLFPMLYFTFTWLFCNYLFVFLHPLTSSPITPHPLTPGNHQNILCIYDSVSLLLVYFVFLDSVVDMYLLPFYCSYFWSS